MTVSELDLHDLHDLAAEGLAAATAAGGNHVTAAVAALRWAADTFGDSLVVMSSMGDEVLVDLAARSVPNIQVAFIDTGYHFPETLDTADAFETTAPIRLLRITPRQSVAEQDATEGVNLFATDPDRCCFLRKVEPLERALAGRDAWVTGMRRVDAPTRGDIDVVTVDAKREMIKLNPLALWTDADIADYVAEHGVLQNPLRELGYPSIGCSPCTRPVAAGEDPRAGRWAGKAKTECGLHV